MAAAILAFILLFPASQAVPDHIGRPAEKAFFNHISNNLRKDIKINALQRFYPTFCRLSPQLSSLTGVSEEYISNYFYPRLKRSGFVAHRCIQEQPLVKRNHFYLPNPTENFRFIRKEFFFDRSISPEEKGVMIGLYGLCLNGTFRYDLPDQRVWETLRISKNTFKKYRNSLIDKNILWSSYDVPMALADVEHLRAKVLMYPHLGHKTWLDLVEEFNPTEDEINDYLLIVEEVA